MPFGETNEEQLIASKLKIKNLTEKLVIEQEKFKLLSKDCPHTKTTDYRYDGIHYFCFVCEKLVIIQKEHKDA